MNNKKAKELRSLAKKMLDSEKDVKYDFEKVKPSVKTIRERMDLFKRGLLEDPQSISLPSIIVKLSKGCARYIYKKLKIKYKTDRIKT